MFILSFDCGVNNLAWSILKINIIDTIESVSINDWGVINLNDDDVNEKKKKLTFEQYNSILISCLLKNFIPSDNNAIPFFDHILIENQSVVSPQNKNISVIIYTFFLTYYKISLQKHDIKFISPGNKFKLNCKPELPHFNIKDKYRIRKKTSIIYAKYYLENVLQDSLHLDQFLNHKKQDDLADSLLQAIYFIEKILKINITVHHQFTGDNPSPSGEPPKILSLTTSDSAIKASP